MTHTITDSATFFDEDGTKIVVEASDLSTGYSWRLGVNDDFSEWYGERRNLLSHKGYAVASGYWEGYLPVYQPFKVAGLKMEFCSGDFFKSY